MSDSTPDRRNQTLSAWDFRRDGKSYRIIWVRGSRELHLYERLPGDNVQAVKLASGDNVLPVILVPGAVQSDVYAEVKRYEKEGW